MRIDQFESDDSRERREIPWRKDAPPINKPTDPNNPNNRGPINHDEWMKSSKPMEEEIDGVPEVGDVIRTKKMQMEGKVERLGKNRAGYDEVFFRVGDGRLMVTPLSNAVVVEKLADEDIVMEVANERVDEISTEVLAKYKAAAGKDATAADAKGDYARGNKRFSGIVNATKRQFSNDAKKTKTDENKTHISPSGVKTNMDPADDDYAINYGKSGGVAKFRKSIGMDVKTGNKKTEEGTMGGINRSAPSNDVSYEKVLDEVKAMWEESQLNELSVEKLRAYKDAATSLDVAKKAPLRKVAKHMQGAGVANQKIKTKTGNAVGMHQPDRGTYEDKEDPLVGQLKKQYADSQAAQPKRKAVPIEYFGYIIKYLAQSKPTDKVDWVIYNKQDKKVANGVAMSDKEAIQDAETWIKGGGGTKEQVTSSVTIDFNEQFRDWFSKEGDKFYATIVNDKGVPTLLLSTEPQKTLKTSHSRSSTHLPMISLTAGESNEAGLQPFGRYLLGSKEDLGDNLLMFPLILQDITQSKTDKKRLGAPGLTVAASGRTE